MRKLLTCSGAALDLPARKSWRDIQRLIDAKALTSVRLADKVHVIFFDTAAEEKERPVNKEATRRYQEARGRDGVLIHGDAVIAPDYEY